MLADVITRDGRRLAIAMHVASLLAVTAHDLGQHETAAILFGFAAAEQDRLDIVLRLSARPLAERARDACRAALGAARFDELAAQGANTEWRGLPTVDASARHEHAIGAERRYQQTERKPVAGCPPTGVVESESCQPEPTRNRPATKGKRHDCSPQRPHHDRRNDHGPERFAAAPGVAPLAAGSVPPRWSQLQSPHSSVSTNSAPPTTPRRSGR